MIAGHVMIVMLFKHHQDFDATVITAFGRVRRVAQARGALRAPLTEISLADCRRTMADNLDSAFLCDGANLVIDGGYMAV